MRTLIWFTGSTATAANSRMITALMRYAQARDWQLLVLPNPHNDAAMRAELAFWHPDGVVTDPSYDPSVFGSIPVIIMSSRPPGYCGSAVFIEHDAVRTTAAASEELLSLGYQHFAYVGALGDKVWSRERASVFQSLLQKHGFTCSTCTSPVSDKTDPLRFQKRLRQFLSDLPRPCALLAAHDQVGQYVIYAANALGISIPDDVAVCSIDNDENVCLNTSPTLTSVLTDYERAGTMAGEAFTRIFDGDKVCDSAYGPVSVIRRGSTADLSCRDFTVVHARELIRREATNGLSASAVAALFACTPRMAQLRFKQVTGHTIMDEILETRTEKAKRLMLDKDLTMEAVAQLSGWRSLRNFQHHFTRATGLPPGRWKAVAHP